MPLRESAPFEGFDDIPDPASGVAARPTKEAAAPTEPSMTRSERQRRSLVALALAVGWVAALVAKLGLRADIGALDVIAPLSLWVVVAAVGLVAALRPRERGLPPPSRVVQVIAALVPALFVLSALAASSGAEQVPLTLRNSGGCVALASVAAAGPFVLAGVIFQRSFLSIPAWRGAAIGAVCGLCAAAGIHTHCPMAASAHVVLAHGFPIAAGGLLGALFGALRGRA